MSIQSVSSAEAPLEEAAAGAELAPLAGLSALTAKLWRRAALGLGLTAFFLFLLAQRLAEVDRAAVETALAATDFTDWALALLATAVSFWAIGRYDLTLHEHLQSRVPRARAARAGILSIAISQFLGLGLVTGTLLRWHLLPGFGLARAFTLTLAVSLGFLGGWLWVTALTLFALGSGAVQVLGALALGLSLWLGVKSLSPRAGRLWPNGLTLGRCAALAGLDLWAAALALYAFLPESAGLPFATLLPAFLLAYGAGLVSGTPGGVGALDLVLVALLPQVTEPELWAALIAWRLAYVALPAALAALTLALRRRAPIPLSPAPLTLAPGAAAALGPEAALAAEGLLHITPLPGGQAWLLGRSRHGLFALAAPAPRPGRRPALAAFLSQARAEARAPALYRAPPRLAVQARRAGLFTLPVSEEALLCPQSFTLDDPARAGLRRKLRKAESAGITFTSYAPGALPAALKPALATLAAEWARAHGGERGFSMGRFCPETLEGAALTLAFQGPVLLAFVSFATAPGAWTLDLIRHGAALPDGVMQALVVAALQQAKAAGVQRFSLAHVPADKALAGAAQNPLLRRILRPIAAKMAHESAGLRQFKTGFAPRWERRYIAAPSPLKLGLLALELHAAIHHPPPLPAPTARLGGKRFAPARALWQS